MSVEVKFKVEYHREGAFYTVRGKRLNDLRALKKMRNKIVSISNVEWKWHVVLTFNDESLEYWFKLRGDVGKALADYFDKVRKKFWGLKYFWKYEEGTKVWCKVCNKKVDFEYNMERKGWVVCNVCKNSFKTVGERPHFHILFDFVNRGVRCKVDKIDDKLKKIRKKNVKQTEINENMYLLEWKEKECSGMFFKKLLYPHHWDSVDWKRWFRKLREHKNNRNRTDLEILMGYWHYRKWGYMRWGKKKGGKKKYVKKDDFIPNGTAYAREIKSYMDLKQYVKKDFFKYTESKWLKDSLSKKWSHSQNLLYEKDLEKVKDWEQVLETIGYYGVVKTLEFVRSGKDNMIEYYNGRGLVGEYIYKRIISEIKDVGMKDIKVDAEIKYGKQKSLNVEAIGFVKCRYCEKEFDVDKGFVGIYCSKDCFMKYSHSMGFRMEKKRKDWDRKDFVVEKR